MISRYAMILPALLCAVSPAFGQTVNNPSFENPNLELGKFIYQPSGFEGMSFFNGAGVQSNLSGWDFGEAPDGVQSAFIQYNGWFTLTVSGLQAGRVYSLSFFDSYRRNTDVYKPAPYSVSFDDQLLGAFVPTSHDFSLVAASSFIASSATGTLTFRGAGLGSDDRAVAIDGISVTATDLEANISAVPEPETWAMMLLGLGFIGAAVRYARPTESAFIRADARQVS